MVRPMFKLSEPKFTLISEGSHIFKITSVDTSKYDKFGKVSFEMESMTGEKHTESFGFYDSKNNERRGVINRYSFFGRVCLNDLRASEFDFNDLEGCFIKGNITHEEYTKTKGEKAGEKGVSAKFNDFATVVGDDLKKAINYFNGIEDDEVDEDLDEDFDDFDDEDDDF